MTEQTKNILIGLSTEQSLADVAKQLGLLLNLTFQERDSSYWGGVYFKARGGSDEEIYLIRNSDPVEKAPIYPAANDYPYILRLDRTARSERELIDQLRHTLQIQCEQISE